LKWERSLATKRSDSAEHDEPKGVSASCRRYARRFREVGRIKTRCASLKSFGKNPRARASEAPPLFVEDFTQNSGVMRLAPDEHAPKVGAVRRATYLAQRAFLASGGAAA